MDNFDNHFTLLNQGKNPDDEVLTNQEFIVFYRYISVGIEDDSFFNKMISGLWGVIPKVVILEDIIRNYDDCPTP